MSKSNAQPCPRRSGSGLIVASMCLIGVPCRYDGKARPHPAIVKLLHSGRILPLCPEQLGGLPTPRSPAEIVGGDGHDVLCRKARVVNVQGDDVTEEFLAGAELATQIANRARAERAILQDKSPACGVCSIYNGTFSGRLTQGVGVWAALMQREGYEVQPPPPLT